MEKAIRSASVSVSIAYTFSLKGKVDDAVGVAWHSQVRAVLVLRSCVASEMITYWSRGFS